VYNHSRRKSMVRYTSARFGSTTASNANIRQCSDGIQGLCRSVHRYYPMPLLAAQ